MIAVIATAALDHPVVAMGASAGATGLPHQELGEVVVTSRVLQGAAASGIPPERQLNPAEIAAYGVSTISDLLSELSAQTQSDQGRDGGAAPVVLVNGRRISGIDEVGDLPTEAIQRIDILPEEVALKYGYGAQQKVVNIVLRGNLLARVARLNGGASTEGGGINGSSELSDNRIHGSDRIHVVGRVSAQAALYERDRGVSSTAGTISDPRDSISDDSAARTLKPATNSYSLNGVIAHPVGEAVTATFNASASVQNSRALLGHPAATFGSGNTAVARFLSDARLLQIAAVGTVHAGVTLNADLPKQWRLSVVGSYDYDDSHTRTDRGYDPAALKAAISAGSLSPNGPVPLSALGSLVRQDATAISHAGSVSALANGALFKLPTGDVAISLKLDANYTRQYSASTAVPVNLATRTQFGAVTTVDVPLSSRSSPVLGGIGDLGLSVTGAVTRVSAFGALGTVSYALHWTPHVRVNAVASLNEDRQVPTLAQLGGPLVTKANVRQFDYVQGRTVTVTSVSGGNPALQADDRQVFKLGATVALIDRPATALKAWSYYLASTTRNAIEAPGGATAVAEESFPDRFGRDPGGTLVLVDNRAVNFLREDRRSLRSGFTLTRTIHSADPTQEASGDDSEFEMSLYHSWFFQDEVRLGAGAPSIDLLEGGTIGPGAHARHKVQVTTGANHRGIGVRLGGAWTSPFRISGRGGGAGALWYSSLATLDVRMFADLQRRFDGRPWAHGLRASLAVTNVFDTHQHVRDASGATPLIYGPAFLDPDGRTVSFSVRRLL